MPITLLGHEFYTEAETSQLLGLTIGRLRPLASVGKGPPRNKRQLYPAQGLLDYLNADLKGDPVLVSRASDVGAPPPVPTAAPGSSQGRRAATIRRAASKA
jgi:hypothetical protein